MATNTDFRKVLTDPTPLYFAAGVLDKLRSEAPERIAKLRETDPKTVQARMQQALASLDTDVKKWREQAQTLALQGVGYAAEAAVKAKEGYDALAEQGKVAVEGWRGRKEGETDSDYATTIEREPVTVTEPVDGKTKFSEQAEPSEPPKRGAGTTSTASAKSATTTPPTRKAAGDSATKDTAAKDTAAKDTAKDTAAKSAGARSTAKSGTAKGGTGAKASGTRKTTPPSAS
ncbi:hypothetical protein JJV70_14855 [Streptomyces sp. JJ66]|uniref:hypothetical protein n=1 Tax=Streptomyces sp. JJ66 TaxID=2803843 RepID=UPI001C55CF28|nr:hypothetical protein [Streptomyces sp. JJ66]MBW1603357.1 hypothetical protein [Streptomyces sp. JJ66]